jgi:tetratricopeptide (TPR) repeat protein
LATNNWERPVYFNNTSANTSGLDLRPWLQLEGMAFRLMPIRNPNGGEVGEVNIDVMKENLSQFEFRGFNDPGVYHDEEYRKFGSNTRNSYARLARALYETGDIEGAKAILEEAMTNIPDESIPYSYFTSRFVEIYYMVGEKEKAEEIAGILARRSTEFMDYMEQTGTYNDNLYKGAMLFPTALADIYRRLSINTVNKERALQEEVNLEGNDAALQKIQADKEFYMQEFEKYDQMLEQHRSRVNALR